MKLIERFFLFSVVTAFVFSLATVLFADHLVFGNYIHSGLQGLLMSSLLVGFVSAVTDEVAMKIKEPKNVRLFVHWVANTLVIYFLARTAVSETAAIGIRAFWVAIILGVAVNLAQYAVLKTAEKK